MASVKFMLAIVLGTRPEIIKCAPIILEAQRRGVPVGIVHTGQHYTPELDDIFFKELRLPKPLAHAHVGSHPAARQIGLIVQRLADALDELKPSMVMVQGDTNSVLSGALAGYKMGMLVAHLEAGLRSDDWTMPEEMNRVLADRLSRWLFCPTDLQRERLKGEGIENGIHVVGNSIVDAVKHYSGIAYKTSDVIERLQVAPSYALLTMHRPNNVDDPARLAGLLEAIGSAARELGLQVVFPIHPRTKNILDKNAIRIGAPFLPAEPLGYLDLLRLQLQAAIILTDSGGIQEEACILQVPCVTLRPNTERPETVRIGASILHHEADAALLLQRLSAHLKTPRTWENPFGDGQTAVRVMDILEQGR